MMKWYVGLSTKQLASLTTSQSVVGTNDEAVDTNTEPVSVTDESNVGLFTEAVWQTVDETVVQIGEGVRMRRGTIGN